MDEYDRNAEPVDGLSTTINDESDDELRALVKPELEVGERLLWAARANPRSPSTFSDLRNRFTWAAAFGIVSIACLSDFFGLYRSLAYRLDGLFALVGSLAGIIALIMIIVCIPYWFCRRAEFAKMANQRYALTDRRAILWRRNPKSGGDEVFQFTPDKIRDIHRVEYPDGRGDVVIRLTNAHWAYPSSFQGVANVRIVEGMARRILLRIGSGKSKNRPAR